MTDIRSQILEEVEENLGAGYVQTFNDVIENSPTLAWMIYVTESNYESKKENDKE